MRAWLVRHRSKLRRQMPTAQELAQQRWLRPVAHRISDPELWHMHTESMARGTAIGVFWAFAVPFGQIVFAAAHCVWWRGNIPVAAAITFVTNPLTIGFWLWLAYQLGSLVVAPAVAVFPLPDVGWIERLQVLGWPTLVGMALFATVGSAAGYLSVRGGSRLWFHWRLALRRRRNRQRSAEAILPAEPNPEQHGPFNPR